MYEELASAAELAEQQLLQAHHYNSVGNLLRFYQEFRTSEHHNLAHFFRQYAPPITPEHYTCVGLALELLRRLANLEQRFPGIGTCLYLVSCEESIDEVDEYIHSDPGPYSTEKEHVMVAMQLVVAGRPGIMLLDPGYHVARVVTVMADSLYPHTGWFPQSDEANHRKEYNYTMSSDLKYVIWSTREMRDNFEIQNLPALIYVAQSFLCPIDVTERRNLVYNFRSLLARDTKGHVIAGFYFKIPLSEPAIFTIFHQNGNTLKKVKASFKTLLQAPQSEELLPIIKKTNEQMGFWAGHLEVLLTNLAAVLADTDFVTQLLGINKHVGDISCDN